MLTTAQYDYLKADLVLPGVWDTIVKESPIIQRLPFLNINNDIVKYNVELTMPTISWLGAADNIPENTGTFEQRTTDIFKAGGDAYTSKSKIATNPTQNIEQIDITAKAKAMAYGVETAFVLGQTTTLASTSQPKGVCRMTAEMETSSTTDLDGLNNSQVIDATFGSDGASGALTMKAMDRLVNAVRPGKPDMLLMSRLAHEKLSALQKASGGGVIMVNLAEFGLQVPSYAGIPIFISDFIPDNFQDGASSVLTIASYNPGLYPTTRPSGYDNTIIFALKASTEDCCGVQVGGMRHERDEFNANKDVITNRFIWLISFMCKKKYSLACLININPDT